MDWYLSCAREKGIAGSVTSTVEPLPRPRKLRHWPADTRQLAQPSWDILRHMSEVRKQVLPYPLVATASW